MNESNGYAETVKQSSVKLSAGCAIFDFWYIYDFLLNSQTFEWLDNSDILHEQISHKRCQLRTMYSAIGCAFPDVFKKIMYNCIHVVLKFYKKWVKLLIKIRSKPDRLNHTKNHFTARDCTTVCSTTEKPLWNNL